jgi:deoxyribodipyrimidine photo-lyase
VLPLVVVEPEFWQQADASARQWAFCAESLEDLRQELARLGQPLVVRTGRIETVLERARRQFGVAALWSHEETGNGWTYARDLRVAAWAQSHGIAWIECPQFGVVRRLKSRNGWARRWEGRMAEAISPPPEALPPLGSIEPGSIPSAQDLGLAADPCPGRQPGGRPAGLALLESFLAKRGARYHRELSSPGTAFASCSRLSPHLSWGTLSMREIVQRGRSRLAALKDLPAPAGMIAPQVNFPAHQAQLGMAFASGSMFPQKYRNGMFVASHGSWNRTKASGALINFVSLKADGTADKSEVFAEGWMDANGVYRGRPVDVAMMKELDEFDIS